MNASLDAVLAHALAWPVPRDEFAAGLEATLRRSVRPAPPQDVLAGHRGSRWLVAGTIAAGALGAAGYGLRRRRMAL